MSDSNFKHLLTYCDYGIKVGKIILVLTKTTLAFLFTLLEIFYFIELLATLQSKNGAEFNK